MGGAPQLVDIGSNVETCRQESLCEAGTRAVLEDTKADRTIHSGSAEGGQEMTGSDGGRGCVETSERRPSLPCEAWRRMIGWYIAAVDHVPPSVRITLERITVVLVEL